MTCFSKLRMISGPAEYAQTRDRALLPQIAASANELHGSTPSVTTALEEQLRIAIDLGAQFSTPQFDLQLKTENN